MARITINNVDDDVAEYLKREGFSRSGPKFLKAAWLLDRCDILQHLLIMYDKGQHEKSSLLDIIDKAVDIGRIIEGGDMPEALNVGDAVDKPETVPVTTATAPRFGV